MFVRPHGIHIDRDGNVWVTDGEGPDGKDPRRNGKGHQVFKFSPDGKLLMTLGKAGVAGDGPDTFNMPSAVLVAPKRRHLRRRRPRRHVERAHREVLEGRQVHQDVGKKGSAPGDFDVAGTARAGDGLARAAFRRRSRQQPHPDLRSGRQVPRGVAAVRTAERLFIDRNDTLYVADHQSNPQTNPGFMPGIRIGSIKDGKVTTFIPETAAEPSQENVAADAAGNVYGSLTGGMALRKYVRK
jgi:hypothetical protein